MCVFKIDDARLDLHADEIGPRERETANEKIKFEVLSVTQGMGSITLVSG